MMDATKTNEPLRYFVYARKSSEGEERQVQSIEDQTTWAQEVCAARNIQIVGTFSEQQSAKKPRIRPVFAEMVKRIEDGEADGILCWQINRLSRNPIDSGTLQWLLQREVVRSIITNDREYLPSDNTLLLSIDTGMSSQYIIDLRANVWRGMEGKIRKGWYPSRAPLGYLNDKTADQGERTIFQDMDRWHMVREIWDLMLTGSYNPRQIQRIMAEKGLTTRKTKRMGGGPITINGMYKMLNNIFYTGNFMMRGELFQGAHPPMITMSEFQRVQQLLGARGKPHAQRYEFSYTGMIHCGECGCWITAETKTKYIKSVKETRSYTYYRCIKRKGPCSQRPMRIEALESQILHELSSITIMPEFKDFALDVLKRENDRELAFRTQKHKLLSAKVQELEQELYQLNKTFTRGVLDDDFYLTEKKALKDKITIEQSKLRESRGQTDRWLTITENIFKFACHAAEAFAESDVQSKREMFKALGGEFTLTDGVLKFVPEGWFDTLYKEYPDLEKQLTEVRTKKIRNLHLEIMEIAQIFRSWYTRTDSNRRPSVPKTDALIR